jgi:hypothetical protein
VYWVLVKHFELNAKPTGSPHFTERSVVVKEYLAIS